MADYLSPEDRGLIDSAIAAGKTRIIPRATSAFAPGETTPLRSAGEIRFRSNRLAAAIRAAEERAKAPPKAYCMAEIRARNERIVGMAPTMTSREISAAVGCSIKVVRNVLNRAGVQAKGAKGGRPCAMEQYA